MNEDTLTSRYGVLLRKEAEQMAMKRCAFIKEHMDIFQPFLHKKQIEMINNNNQVVVPSSSNESPYQLSLNEQPSWLDTNVSLRILNPNMILKPKFINLSA